MTRNQYQPLVLVLLAVCAGIVMDRKTADQFSLSFELWWCVAAAGFGAWLILWWFERDAAAMAMLVLTAAAVGAAWHHARWDLYADDDIGRFATATPQPVYLEAIAVAAPRAIPAPPFDPLRSVPSSSYSRLTVEAVGLRDGDQWRTVSGRARLMVQGAAPEILAGDRIRAFGQLEAPMPAANPGEFDFALHSRADRVLAAVQVKLPACITVVERGSIWNLARWIDEARQRGDQLLWSYLNHDRAGLAAAVLLGEREQVDRETNEAFMETGTVHVLSISGLHVGILAWLLFAGLRSGMMPRRWALAAVMLVTAAYMLLTNAEPPVVRATLLVWIVCGALWLGRTRVGLNSLALAALVVLAVNPADLFRTGVQLSFLSAAVLMWAAPRLSDWPPSEGLNRLIAASRPWPQQILGRLARGTAQFFVIGALLWVIITPLTMARFHLLSPAALVLNVVLAPVVVLAMVAGFGVLLFGWWLYPLAVACAWLCDWCLNVLDSVVKSAAHWPGGKFWVVGPNEVWLAAFYLGVAALMLLPRWLPPLRWRVGLASGYCGLALFVALPLPAAPNQSLRCTFVAVGHGGAHLLELPDGKTLLYDAGRLGAPSAAVRSISGVLWSRGISHLDAVVLSHADTDHYNALPELLDRFSVGVIYVSPTMFRNDSVALKTLRYWIEHTGTPIEYVYAGNRLRAGGGATIEVLHPPPRGLRGRDNVNSIVLSIDYLGRRMLLTGDLEPPGLEEVIRDPPYRFDVLLAPHHGSPNSDPPRFAAWTRPRWVIISGSRADDRPAVREAYEARGATVLNTAHCGAIDVTIDSAGLRVDTFHPAAKR